MNKLILGDCNIELQKLIENNIKFDAIICDPPYNFTNNIWDKKLFNWDILFSLLLQLRKNERTPIILFFNQNNSKLLTKYTSKYFKYKLYWNKVLSSGFLNVNRQPLTVIEEILVFYEKLPIYNPQKFIGKPNHSKGKPKEINKNNNYNHFNFKESDISGLKYPTNLLTFSKIHPSKMKHPTQKPIELMEWLIKTYTKENDLILDFTCGVGSTLISAKNLNRNYVGIELEEKYYEIAKELLNEKDTKLSNTN